MIETILVFGSSIAMGYEDSEGGGWVQRLRSHLDMKASIDDYQDVYNLGISGDTTRGLLKRLESEAAPRVRENRKTIIIIEIGTNDSRFLDDRKQNETSRQEFRKNLEGILMASRKFTGDIIFLGMLPVDRRASPTVFNKNFFYRIEDVKDYDKIIREFCSEKKVMFIDMMKEWEGLEVEGILEDGLHPNSKGHELIFRQVLKYLEKHKLV